MFVQKERNCRRMVEKCGSVSMLCRKKFVQKERNCRGMVGKCYVERNCNLSTTGKMVYGGSAKSGHRDNMMSRTTTGYEDKQTQRGYTSCIFSTNCLIFLKDKGISGEIYLEVQMQRCIIAITARSLTGRLF